MTISYQPIANSTFLDFTGYRVTGATTVESAYGITDGEIPLSFTNTMNVALVLPRNQDPAGLLAQDWGTRQETLEALNAAKSLWTTYGAVESQYQTLVDTLESDPFGLDVLYYGSANGNYTTSAASRTIWVNIATAADFETLFGTELMYSPSQGLVYWNGNLSLPSGWNVTGLWFDRDAAPPATNLSTGTPVTLAPGAQGIGNSTASPVQLAPQDIAKQYNFPLNGETVQSGTIGLIEHGIGSALPATSTQSFEDLLADYLASIGVTSTSGTLQVQGSDGQSYNDGDGGERSLDVAVVAAINPNAKIGLFVGSGDAGVATSTVFTAIQDAIWLQAPTPVGNTTSWAAVTSSSFSDGARTSPGSPFYRAYRELFVDAALSNQTTFVALGDGGSGNELANGLTNVNANVTHPWNILVGGTSLSTTAAAKADATLDAIVASAMANDLATVWQLVAGGLKSLPANAPDTKAFVESVWNNYYVRKSESGQLEITSVPGSPWDGGYLVNSTGSGGVDATQAIPSYQVDFGLHPVTSDNQHLVGRGAPDVSAIAGGNLAYVVPNADMVGTTLSGGTSAASPLWASLAVQINTIFADQNLPNLGYMNDLLYTVAAIAPAAFNDITLGNNTSSFFEPGQYLSNGSNISPTGYGYAAGWGYDLTSGLGSPNGVLLARALTAIAHSELSFDDSVPQVLNSYGAGGWTSGADQSLLIQSISPAATDIDITAGTTSLALSSEATAAYAWTARFAGQAGQLGFEADLVRLFDQQGHGAVGQVTLEVGDTFAVSRDGESAQAVTAPLTNQFGFVDFQTDSGMVRVARPVAVAETVGAADDQTAVVNIRQNGIDSLQLTFYRIDDFTGSIGAIKPGDAGYETAVLGRAYQIGATGTTSITGPGYGQFVQAKLSDVDAGDIVAMKLVNTTQGKTFWAFSQANEVVDGEPVGHIWNYGLNTWGWEDAYDGGDGDYNDLVVNLDFTSAFGHGWLV